MAMTTFDNLQINRLELSEVYCPDDPQVDIVLVHGLNGHPRNTWTTKNGVFWPAQLLPKSLGSVKARILVYGYNADVYAFGGKSATSDYVHQHAQTLVTTLDAERFNEDATQRPIIFVAHSLGGILVKRALEYSAGITSDNTQDLRSIFVSTYGIIFLGTPHNGADPAKWGKVLESMCGALLPRKLLDTEPQLVRTLQTQSETLQNINLGFVNIMDRFHLCFFHEAAKTNFGITQDFVVDQNSACPILPGATYAGIEASHSEMCKFESKNAPGYTAVSANLKRFAQAAPARIRANWSQEMANREQAKQFQAFQLLGVAGITDRHPASSYPTLSPPAGPGRIFSSPGRSRNLPAPGDENRFDQYVVEEVEEDKEHVRTR